MQANWVSDSKTVLQHADVDFFEVRPTRYWFDFLLSLVIAYTGATVFLTATPLSVVQLCAFPIAVFWLYRLSSLVHEVAHLQHGEMRVFKVTWNLLVGVMTLSPSPFFTRHHRDHHTARHFGTPQDPEYMANIFRPGSVAGILVYVSLILVFPVLVFVRFLLTPLTFLRPSLRNWVLAHACSLTMNPHYTRRLNKFDRWSVTSVELLCCLRAWIMLAIPFMGWGPWYRIPLMYLIAVATLGLNQMRLLGDHHLNSEGKPLDMADHLLDSCNYTSRDPLTSLLFPFSIRYHALHHLFPSLPYHNLAAAHRYLMQYLPADSPYRSLDQGSWWHVARGVIRPRNARLGPLSVN